MAPCEGASRSPGAEGGAAGLMPGNCASHEMPTRRSSRCLGRTSRFRSGAVSSRSGKDTQPVQQGSAVSITRGGKGRRTEALYLFITYNLAEAQLHGLASKPSLDLKLMCGAEHTPRDWAWATQSQAHPSLKGNREVTSMALKISSFRLKQQRERCPGLRCVPVPGSLHV